jgi:protocatechuate 3,4-dioxygenase beta subunit
VRFTVLNAKTCTPIKNADVEIWHADATGNYSGVNGASSRFLRGHQKANAAGKAEFLTIFPGWYPGRTPHIHMKVYVGGNTVHTGQVFFNEKIAAAVYKQSPYAERGEYDTPHARDSIYRQAGGSSAELKLARRTGGLKGYVGTIAIGVVV